MRRLLLYAAMCVAFGLPACDTGDDSATGDDLSDSDNENGNNSGGDDDLQLVTFTPSNLLFVERSVHTSYAYVDMWFAPPTELGATGYTLQYSVDDHATWQNFEHGGADLTTGSFDNPADANNFSIDIGQDSWLRLLIVGGTYDGETSNEVWVTRCTTEAYVSSWSLDESVGNSGVMAPNVGYGLAADFVVTRYTDSVALENVLNYQWYRVNPSDYSEITAIAGATSLSYTTTEQDRGFFLLIRADGNGTDFNGFAQIVSTWIVE